MKLYLWEYLIISSHWSLHLLCISHDYFLPFSLLNAVILLPPAFDTLSQYGVFNAVTHQLISMDSRVASYWCAVILEKIFK